MFCVYLLSTNIAVYWRGYLYYVDHVYIDEPSNNSRHGTDILYTQANNVYNCGIKDSNR